MIKIKLIEQVEDQKLNKALESYIDAAVCSLKNRSEVEIMTDRSLIPDFHQGVYVNCSIAQISGEHIVAVDGNEHARLKVGEEDIKLRSVLGTLVYRGICHP